MENIELNMGFIFLYVIVYLILRGGVGGGGGVIAH